MAEQQTTEAILDIRVNYAEAVKGIADYTQKIKEARDAQDALMKSKEKGLIGEDEYRQEIAASNIVIKQYQGEIRTLNKEIQNNIKEQESQNGSLKQLRAQLSNLTKAYDELSKEERDNGKAGQELRDKINSVTTELKAAEEATQRYYRNVGNYENAIKNTLGMQGQWFTKLEQLQQLMAGGLKNALSTAGTAVTNLGKQFLALLANPIVATIAAIVAVFLTLQKALKSNEEGTRALERVMAPFEAVVKVITNALQNLAQTIISAVEGFENLAMGLSKLAERLPIVGKLFSEVNSKIQENIALTKAKQALEDQVRQTELDNAEAARNVAKLRAEAAEISDPAKRAEKLKQALNLEEQQLNRQLAIAKERLRIAEAEAAQTKNSKEDNDKLIQARAELMKAEESYYSGTMRIRSQLRSADEAIAREHEANQKAMTEATKKEAEERARIIAESKAKELAAIRQADDALIALINDNVEQRRAQIEVSYQRRIEDLKRYLETEKNLTETAVANINAAISALYQQRNNELAALNQERIAQEIKSEEERLRLVIETTRKGSQEQFNARMELLQQQQDAATQEIENAALTERQKQERLDLVRQEYEQKRAELRVEQNELEMQAVQEEFEIRLQQQIDNETERARIEMEQKKAALDALHQMEGESNDAFRKRELDAVKVYTESKKKYDEIQKKSELSKLQAAQAITGSLIDLMNAAGEENKAAAMASKILALAQIAISTGVALAQGIQQAQSVPYPANIAAIATTVAAVISGIASAISTVNSAKFSTGGMVEGPGTSTSDSIPARLSDGESVINAQATKMFAPLLSSLNQLGGGVPIVSPSPTYTSPSAQGDGMEMMTEAMAKGVSELHPVVSVEEISDVQNRVEVIETLAQQ